VSQTLFLDGTIRRIYKDEECIGKVGLNICCALNIDLKKHIAPSGRVWKWTSLEIVQELSPFEKPSSIDMGQKLLPSRKVISICSLVYSRGSGGP